MFDLKSFRVDNKISQYELAEFLKVQQPFISQIEKGKDPMPDSWIPKLSEKYDINKYFIDETSNVNIHQKFKHSYGVIGQVTGGSVDIHHDEGKDKVIKIQDKAVEQMFKTMLSELHEFHKSSELRDEYVIKQEAYVAEIIKKSYFRNKENMERIDKLIEQQNKLLGMVINQNERTQNRADKIVDALIKTNVNK